MRTIDRAALIEQAVGEFHQGYDITALDEDGATYPGMARALPVIAKALFAPIQEYLFELHADIEWTTDHFLPGPNSEAYVADRRKLLAELGALLDALEAEVQP